MSRAGSWRAGGLSYHTNFCPHGGRRKVFLKESLPHMGLSVTAAEFGKGSEMELVPMWVGDGVFGQSKDFLHLCQPRPTQLFGTYSVSPGDCVDIISHRFRSKEQRVSW